LKDSQDNSEIGGPVDGSLLIKEMEMSANETSREKKNLLSRFKQEVV